MDDTFNNKICKAHTEGDYEKTSSVWWIKYGLI
jgi:hypothetical protein